MQFVLYPPNLVTPFIQGSQSSEITVPMNLVYDIVYVCVYLYTRVSVLCILLFKLNFFLSKFTSKEVSL